MNALIRSIFYRLPKVGEIYVFDAPKRRDPWASNPPHEVKVLDVRCGWVRYEFRGDSIFNDQRLSRSYFHFCYVKRQNPAVMGFRTAMKARSDMETNQTNAAAREEYPGRRCSAFHPAFVLVGRKSRHLAIPNGYALVETGEARDGDLFANLMTSQWSPVEREDIGVDAINFDYLIRRQNPVVRGATESRTSPPRCSASESEGSK